MSSISDNTGKVDGRALTLDEGDRSAQEQAKQEAVLLRLAKPVQANASHEIGANRLGKEIVTLHLPEPINAALRGSQGTFRRFVPGWDQVWSSVPQSEHNAAMLQDFSLTCGFTQPLSLRHTISSPSQPTSTPAGVSDPSLCPAQENISPDFPARITLEPFQRSTSTPGYSSTSFGTSASAFSIANNSFVRLPSMAREQRHSASAFGPAQFYSQALEDTMERTAIEVEHRPETCATNFLSSNVQILRRRRRRQGHEGDGQPLPVTIVQETEPVLSLVVPDGDAPNTSALSGCSELSTLLHEDENAGDGADSATVSETNGQLELAEYENVTANRCNLHDRDSPRTTHSSATGSGSSTLGLSTISETDREVAEANKLAEQRRNRALGGDCDNSSGSSSTSTHRYLALGGSGVRDGATLPVDRLFSQNASPGPMFRFRTSSSTSSSQRSGTATTYRSASATASSVASSCAEDDPPVFVSYSPSRPTRNEVIATPTNYRLPAEYQPLDDSPLVATMMESEVLFADTGLEGQYRIRSRFVPPQGPRQTVANEHSVEVSVDGVAGTGVTPTVITPEKDQPASGSS